jgi:tryptophan synthase alpha chain
VNFITPESSEEAIKGVSEINSPFIYFISKRGITGGEFNIDEETRVKIKLAGKLSSSPVVLGFGISDSSSAVEALKNADGFIMGTALARILKNKNLEAYVEFVDKLFTDINTAAI